MKEGEEGKPPARRTASRFPETPRSPRPAKTPPPTPETVAARLLALFPPSEPPALWNDSELKRRLTAAERPLLAAALAHLQAARQLLALPQGKGTCYLFAEPLRGWLAGAPVARAPVLPDVPGPGFAPEDLFAAYARLVERSGGFPDVKIAALRTALDPASAGALTQRLVGLWREGRATLSQGDWSLADAATRRAAVELNGERYLLVRLG